MDGESVKRTYSTLLCEYNELNTRAMNLYTHSQQLEDISSEDVLFIDNLQYVEKKY